MHVCVGTCVYICTCGGQGLVLVLPLSHSLLYILRQGSSEPGAHGFARLAGSQNLQAESEYGLISELHGEFKSSLTDSKPDSVLKAEQKKTPPHEIPQIKIKIAKHWYCSI